MNIQPKPYRFTLIGRTEFIDSNGNKTVDTKELVLDHLPGGWKDYGVEWGLDTKYFGYGTKVAHNIQFFKEAADMLREYYDNFGLNADVTLKVEKGNMNTYQYDFEAEFGINFSEYESWQHHVIVGLDERGIKQMLLAKEKNTYDIPMDSDTSQVVSVEKGMNLFEAAVYEIYQKNTINFDVHREQGQYGFYYVFEFLGMTENATMKLNKDLSAIWTNNYIFQDSDLEIPFWEIKDVTQNETIKVKISQELVLRFVPASIIYLNGDSSFRLRIRISQVYNSTPDSYVIYDQDFNLKSYPHDEKVSIPIILDNDTIMLKNINSTIKLEIGFDISGMIVSPSVIASVIELSGRCSFEYYGSVVTNPFSFRAYQLEDWAQKIFKEMRGTDDYNFVDEIQDGGQHYLSQYKDRIMVTSADAIRGIEGAVGKGCFSDFYDALTGVIGCGAAVEGNKMYFLSKESVFDPNTEIANIGRVSRIKVSPYIENIKNRFKFGYPNKDYDKLNGRQEFNTTVEFISEFKYLEADNIEQSFVGKYRADSFGIQWLRWEYSKKSSTDSKSDNDMFFVAVRKDSNGKLIVEQDVNHHLEQKGLFNFFLSPKRNIMRNSRLLAAYSDKLPAQSEIRFISSEKVDSNLVSQIPLDGEASVSERDAVKIYDLGAPLFKPIIFDFDSAYQFAMPEKMKKPRGYIRFNYFGLELKGFILEMTEATTPKKAQEIKLIAHPDTPNNVSWLISQAGHGKTPI